MIGVLELHGAGLVLIDVLVVVHRLADAVQFAIQPLLDLRPGLDVPELPELELQFEVHASRHERIAAGLVHRADPVDVELLGDLAETTLVQVVDLTLDLLAVVEVPKVPLEALEELVLLRRQVGPHQLPQQVAKVDAAVERDPVVAPVHAQAARDQVFSQQGMWNAICLVLVEIKSRLTQHRHRVIDRHLFAFVEKQVELPGDDWLASLGEDAGGRVPVAIGHRDADLDQLQVVAVGLDHVVLELVFRIRRHIDRARVLSVLCAC